MINIHLFGDDVVIQQNTSLSVVKDLLQSYSFEISQPEDFDFIICHGSSWIDENEKTVFHLYFDKKSEVLTSAVIHTFPINFDYIQKYLERYYGTLFSKKTERNIIWNFSEGTITHSIIDRYGEEEGIYFNFI